MSGAIGDRPSVGFDLLNSGRALLGLGRPAEADTRLHDALAIGRELNQHEIIAHSQVSLAKPRSIAAMRPWRTNCCRPRSPIPKPRATSR